MSSNRMVQLAVGAIALASVVACNTPTDSGRQGNPLVYASITLPTGTPGHVIVCKDGPAGTYGFTVTAHAGSNLTNVNASNQFSLAPGACVDIANALVSGGGASVTVQETAPQSGTQFVRTDIFGVTAQGGQTGPTTGGNPTSVTFGDAGKIIVFVDQLIPVTTGCTFTKGYYRNHPAAVLAEDGRTLQATKDILAATPGQPGSVTWADGNDLLNLYQQLLTALINLNGANGPAALHTAVLAAQAGTDGSGENITTTLTQQQISDLITALDAFNEGTLTGWPHCSD